MGKYLEEVRPADLARFADQLKQLIDRWEA